MKHNRNKKWKIILVWGMGIALFTMACGLSSNLKPTSTPMLTLTSTPTTTPTVVTGGGIVTPTPNLNICEGLAGTFEMQVLVGPSDAVGLEPVAIGDIPFSVTSDSGIYIVQGSGSISYQDVLAEEWGTYTVNFDLEAAVQGECKGDEQTGVLNITINTSGEQLVEVRSEGFQGDYPWSGPHDFDLNIPIVEGATAEGEGWAFVLHINK
jgi:hypothetical protein